MRKISPVSDCVAKTVVELLRYRAAERPDDAAYFFLSGMAEKIESLTYAELDMRARAIGTHLQEAGAEGERALLLFPAGLDFITAFFGCMYGGVIGVPVNPPHPARLARTLPKVEAIVEDTQASLALTNSSFLDRVRKAEQASERLLNLSWLATENFDPERAAEWKEFYTEANRLAFLQYTSGSTSVPRGVMVSHENILMNLQALDQALKHGPDSVMVCWIPNFHDMGLIYGILQPLFGGFKAYLMAPALFVQQPFRWLQAISTFRGTHSAAPNFAYDLCARRVTPEQRGELDLSHWQASINGAEPVRLETMKRFYDTFKPCGFRYEVFCPGYGLAESTLRVTVNEKLKSPISISVKEEAFERNRIAIAPEAGPGARTLVGCGRVPGDGEGEKILIVDPHTSVICPPGVIGEIWVSGPSVTLGYWNRREETERIFRARPAGAQDGAFLRTGDLGVIIDGELFVTGRIKDLIIIEGRNHYPQDIEQTIESSHPLLRQGCSAAFSFDLDGKDRLGIVAEIERRGHVTAENNRGKNGLIVDDDRLLKDIRRVVFEEHDLQAHSIALIKAGTIPKTSSGKIQRQSCRAAFLANTLETICHS